MISITHDQLRELQTHKGQLDADSGRVFVGVRGAMNQVSQRWFLEVNWRSLETGEQLPAFSFGQVTGSVAEMAAPVQLQAIPESGGCCG